MEYAVDLHSNNFLVGYYADKNNVKRKRYYFNKNGLDEFKKILTKDDIVAVESTINSYYFYDEIKPIVKEVKIVNTVRFKIISESSSKTDKKDVKNILDFLKLGILPEITIPSKFVRELRGLFSTYILLVKEKTANKNRIHSLLKDNGLFINKSDIFSVNIRKLIDEKQVNEIRKVQINTLLDEIELKEKSIERIKNQILTYSSKFKEELEILMSIPGISLFIGLAIMADIGDIKNFKNAKKLSAYLGIVPRVKESNRKVRTGKITKKGRKIARSFLSQVIFHFINSSEVYTEFYESKKKTKGSGKAIVAMMRKLVVVIYNMLKKNVKYYYVKEELHKRKLQEWIVFMKKFKAMSDDDWRNWDNRVRIKYDLRYRNEKLKRMQKSA